MTSFAIVRTGGKQYRVTPGDTLRVESLAADEGDTIELTDVILLSDEKAVVVGTPTIHNAKVTAEVIRHAVDWLREVEQFIPDGVVILEPTSPGRQSEHIQRAINLLFTDDTDSLASVGLLPQNHTPQKQLNFVGHEYIMGIDGTHPKDMIMRRQEMPKTYVFDGNIFACRTNIIVRDPLNFWGERVKGLVVDSRYSVDLNNPEEWLPAENKLRFLLD